MGRFVRSLWIVGLAAFLLVLPSPSREPVARGQAPQPNVLIFMTDDQRSDTMFMMPKTQRWFGQQGTRFPSAYATTPLCCPSRASIMTGRYTHNHRVLDNYSALSLDQNSTLQRYLQEAGYLTGITGKYMNAWPLYTNPPYFHRWSIFNTGYQNAKFNTDGVLRRLPGYATDVIGEKSVRFLRFFEGDDARPWLLYVDPFAPHDPFRPAHRHRRSPVPRWEPSPASTESDRNDKPPQVQARTAGIEGIKLVRRLQLRTLIAVDEAVNRVMKELARLGEGGSTLAFFTSDNGFFWAEHGLFDKRWPYTPSIEIPLFMRWPGQVQGGAIDPRLAANLDITPTVLDAAGIPPDPTYPLDGRSLLTADRRDRLLLESFVDRLDVGVPPWASLLTPQYQYVEYYDSNGETVSFREYYDLREDPWQLHNLLAEPSFRNNQGGLVANLSSQLARDRRCRGTDGGSPCP
ncbi:MAG TPA: sulfatase [Actinomycetota bacterium]|nr:sulfatase [Actinomycetota bacterium]